MGKKVLIGVCCILIAGLVVILVAGIQAGGWRGSWASAGSGRADILAVSYEFDSGSVELLDLDLKRDDVEIVPATGSVIRLEQWVDRERPEGSKLQCDLSGSTLRAVSQAADNWFFSALRLGISRIRVLVPKEAGIALRAACGAGNLDLRDLRLGNVELSAGAGDIEVSGVRAAAGTFHSAAGNVSLDGATLRSLDCSTGAGDVDAAGIRSGGEVQLDTPAGNLRFQGSCSRFDGSSGAGDITAEVTGAVRISGSASAGNVEIICPDTAGLETVSAQASAGDVTVALPPGSRVAISGVSGLAELHIDENAAFEIASTDAVQVDVHAPIGDIRLEAA